MRIIKNIRRFWASLLCVLAASGVYAQVSGEQGIFSPFVSQLTAETRNNMVRLNWIDSRDVRGPVYIFRSLSPIESANLSGMQPVEIPYGTQYYVDETENETVYYYYAAASNTNRQRFDIIIPYTNTVAADLSASFWMDNTLPLSPMPGQRMPYSPAPQAFEAWRTIETFISGLSAYAEGERVIITFSISGFVKNIVLYRYTQPIRRIQDLLKADIVQTDNNSPVIDYPEPGHSYYYALLFHDDISRGNVDIQPGRNATIYPVAIAGKPEPPPGIRSMPLPPIHAPNTALPLRSGLEPNRQGSSGTPRKEPRIMRQENEIPAGTDEAALRAIIHGAFSRREWNTARDQLTEYISASRPAAVEARARFYLGQTYYYTGQNREALKEFLGIRDHHPSEASEWINAVIEVLGG